MTEEYSLVEDHDAATAAAEAAAAANAAPPRPQHAPANANAGINGVPGMGFVNAMGQSMRRWALDID